MAHAARQLGEYVDCYYGSSSVSISKRISSSIKGIRPEWHLLNSYSIAVTHNRLIPVIR